MIDPRDIIRYEEGLVTMLDQTRLPQQKIYVSYHHNDDVIDAIKHMIIRGAPAIGVAGAYAICLAWNNAEGNHVRFLNWCEDIREARPTAKNLSWAVDKMLERYRELAFDGEVSNALNERAHDIHNAEVASCQAIGQHALHLFYELGDSLNIMTHCNAGALATAGYGTALGVIYALVEKGKDVTVWVDETRPLRQGARLTAWELYEAEIPFKIITDSAAGSILAAGKVDAVIVGADRIARNGDTANKIGTYPLSVLANRHLVPFYVAAPFSTIDTDCETGKDIPIEERDPHEVDDWFQAYNPAFDVTPATNIDAIITEKTLLVPSERSLDIKSYV